MTKSLKITSCLECPFHRVIADPDPDDWFNADDQAVVCTKEKNPKRDQNSRYASDRQEYRCVSVSDRPYQITKEKILIPKWCPL
jgi:hypothetical protein